jgi:GGDEF domain-containing protein
MARHPGAALAWLVPLVAAAAAAAFLVAARDLQPAASLLTGLLALAGGLLVLHSLLAVHLRQTTAFLAGLELAYATLLLLRAHAAPLLGLGLQALARLLAVTVPVTLILVYALGQGRLLGASASLRAGLIVALPLLAALSLRWFPGPAAAVLELRLVALSRPPWLPQLALLALSALALLLILRRGRGLYELCLAAVLLPRYLLLHQAGSGALRGFPARAALAAVLCLLALLYGLYRLFWQRAFLDELTGIGNRRSFEDALRALPRRYCLAMLDIDHFKTVNDTYGHAEGDNVLRWVAAHIRRAFGSAAFRYGGEEFAVILPETGLEAARGTLEELRRGLAETAFVVRRGPDRRGRGRRRRKGRERRAAGGDRRRTPRSSSAGQPGSFRSRHLQVTVSVGLSAATGGSERPQEALLRADAALYRAKRGGRNRVVAAGGATRGQRARPKGSGPR